jgi:dissimilatory sulfite reductase (desulfoviridin) alpha/beta subunit
VCPVKAINVDKSTDSLSFDENKCIYCGWCVKSCPTDAWDGKHGYITSFGGLYGNNIAFGQNLIPLIEGKETLFKVVDITIEFFKNNANPG